MAPKPASGHQRQQSHQPANLLSFVKSMQMGGARGARTDISPFFRTGSVRGSLTLVKPTMLPQGSVFGVPPPLPSSRSESACSYRPVQRGTPTASLLAQAIPVSDAPASTIFQKTASAFPVTLSAKQSTSMGSAPSATRDTPTVQASVCSPSRPSRLLGMTPTARFLGTACVQSATPATT